MAQPTRERNASARIALAVGIAALLVAALVTVVVYGGRDRAISPFARGTDSATIDGTGSDGPDAGGFNAEARNTVSGNARSVVFEGRILELATATVEGVEAVTLTGQVTGPDGANYGRATVSATGRVTPSGTSMTMAASGLRFRPGQAASTIDERDLAVSVNEAMTIDGTTMRVQRQDEDGTSAPPVTARGPLTVAQPGSTVDATLAGAQLRWIDPPATLRLANPTAGRATLSWAGGGTIETIDGPVSAGFLGVKADQLQGTLTAEADRYVVEGSARLRQVYADGQPKLRTAGAVTVKSSRPSEGGSQAWFTWAPVNRGQHDMTITRISPTSPAASWVNLALDRLPTMCGGEPCPEVGGDTAGLGKSGSGGGFFGIGSRSARPINAVILPGTGDENDISVTIPSGTPAGEHLIMLLVEGNFEPVTAEVRITVR
ncbi:MAG: hypothetical protein ACR2H3_01630 [Acidimicrobiales bacterium]